MVTEFSLYHSCGGHLSLDFANACGRGPEGISNERFTSYDRLLEWSRCAGSLEDSLLERLERRGRREAQACVAILARAKNLREAIFDAFHADLQGQAIPAAALECINRELARALAHARLESTADGPAWTWCYQEELLETPLWPVVRAAADLLVSAERQRIKVCASDRCLWLFLDRSRNQGRRWCDMRNCGNLTKVRRHRERKKKGQA